MSIFAKAVDRLTRRLRERAGRKERLAEKQRVREAGERRAEVRREEAVQAAASYADITAHDRNCGLDAWRDFLRESAERTRRPL